MHAGEDTLSLTKISRILLLGKWDHPIKASVFEAFCDCWKEEGGGERSKFVDDFAFANEYSFFAFNPVVIEDGNGNGNRFKSDLRGQLFRHSILFERI